MMDVSLTKVPSTPQSLTCPMVTRLLLEPSTNNLSFISPSIGCSLLDPFSLGTCFFWLCWIGLTGIDRKKLRIQKICNSYHFNYYGYKVKLKEAQLFWLDLVWTLPSTSQYVPTSLSIFTHSTTCALPWCVPFSKAWLTTPCDWLSDSIGILGSFFFP